MLEDEELNEGDELAKENGSGSESEEKLKALDKGPVCEDVNSCKGFNVDAFGRSDERSCSLKVLQSMLALRSKSIGATPSSVDGCEFAGEVTETDALASSMSSPDSKRVDSATRTCDDAVALPSPILPCAFSRSSRLRSRYLLCARTLSTRFLSAASSSMSGTSRTGAGL